MPGYTSFGLSSQNNSYFSLSHFINISISIIKSLFVFIRLKESIGKKVINALRRSDEAVTHAAVDMICCLMHPMHYEYEIRQEQFNKASILSNKVFLGKLLDMWITHIVSFWNISLSLEINSIHLYLYL